MKYLKRIFEATNFSTMTDEELEEKLHWLRTEYNEIFSEMSLISSIINSRKEASEEKLTKDWPKSIFDLNKSQLDWVLNHGPNSTGKHYEISNRAMNVLYYLIDVNIPTTFADFKEQLLSKIETSGTTTSLDSLHKNYAYIINLLVKDKLIATSINPDNERLFKITNLGRDVLDLSNRVNDFLKDEDCLQSTVRNIQTKFKTTLMFPLWT